MAEKRLTKQEAQQLYDDLQKAVGTMMARGKTSPQPKGAEPSKAKKTPMAVPAGATTKARRRGRLSGESAAFLAVGFFCAAKVALSALEMSGIASVPPAEAAVAAPAKGPVWSKEEVKVLTALDARRVELEERASRVEQRESEMSARDRDIARRLSELKELSDRLKSEREKGDKQRNAQLDQLANVYGSMNPPEAAHLLEQLDIQVALPLVERLPEKRMGQILALMNAQRALEITNLLSKRSATAGN